MGGDSSVGGPVILPFPARDETAEILARAKNVVAVWTWRRGRWVRLVAKKEPAPKRA